MEFRDTMGLMIAPKHPKRSFDDFFKTLSGDHVHHEWQKKLAAPMACENRLIRIPTGFGKTLGVFATWAWHRLQRSDDTWPRRLVWCLPMRVLVEQTEREIRDALRRIWPADCGTGDGATNKVDVYVLMGGADAGNWHLFPERPTVLVGTQDMLLSRAMNRGYASPRARWPMEFGLLNQDALWVMDEVQLMDVGLATSGQLQVFRCDDRNANKTLRPCFTWWMSATLQHTWLEKSPDTAELIPDPKQRIHRIGPGDRIGHLWDDVQKPVEIVEFKDPKALAKEVSLHHGNPGSGKEGLTLVVVNTVERAIEVWKALVRDRTLSKTDIRLIHSRFRIKERLAWHDCFLNRAACIVGVNRIIVSTQIVEAGVDISASLLVTEVAPWTSLVQRFGRCARWGGAGKIIIADFAYDDDKKAAPYTVDELNAARDACNVLSDAGPLYIEHYEEENEALLPSLYLYNPVHLLLRHELDELFDTTSDLSGADIDISRFIRSGDERDVQVFWADAGDIPSPILKPTREELCSVPFLKARDWLCTPKKESLRPGFRAWVWDWLNREWRRVNRSDIYPGQTLLVECRVGGYSLEQGWTPDSKDVVEPVRIDAETGYENRPCWKHDGIGWCPSEQRVRTLPSEDYADAVEEDESLSITDGWQTIASHGMEVGQIAKSIADKLAPAHAKLLHLAGRWHDLGKAHPAFQVSIQADGRPKRDDIAKAPDIAWPCLASDMYRIDATDQRRGFRHELASTLGLFGVLQRHNLEHQALLGPWREWFNAMDKESSDSFISGEKAVCEAAAPPEVTAIEQEVLDLGAEEFDLVAYLVCAHHGKVRVAWHASPADQKSNDTRLRIRGVCEGDILPTLPLADANGGFHQLPATSLVLSPSAAGLSPRTGKSWTERVLDLLNRFGPFTLAWLETILRAADQRASRQILSDILLETHHDEKDLEKSYRTLAQPAEGRAQTPPLGGDSAPCRQLHGDGERAGRRGVDSGATRPSHSATRFVGTSVGILSYRELAPLLAERVADTEFAISNRRFANLPIHDLLLALHRCICADLTPDMAGRWRLRDVCVGEYQAPPHWRVPALMHNYAADLEARLVNLDDNFGEQLIDDLVFAEGHLLHVHPFEDFNGRVSRLFLVELLYRLNLPVVDLAASSSEETRHYFTALHAYDLRDLQPLSAIWRRRFAQEDIQ